MRAIPFCLFLYRRLAMKNGRGGRIALSEIPFRASPPCLSDFRRLCPKGCLCFRCGLFRPAGWTGSFLYFFFSLPLTVALLPVPAGALAGERLAAGGHGQQCIVSGFHFFVFFLLPRGRSFRFLSFYLFICRHEDGPVRAHSPHGASPQGGFFVFCLDSYRDAGCPVFVFSFSPRRRAGAGA